MLRRLVCAVVVLAVGVGITLAADITGTISKVDGKKVTFTEVNFKEKTKGEPKTLPVSDKVKVLKGNFNKENFSIDAGDAIEGGLKNKMFTEIGERGVFARIITDKDNKEITEIRAMAGFGKGKGKGKETDKPKDKSKDK